ncbi:MAG: sulfatase-like hydrolase/transferase [Acidobacteria bacterium]|nr:sulfatase-like hydrolase/transferase [Acidobacteriota bacterium]
MKVTRRGFFETTAAMAVPAPKGRPNVLLLMTDQHRYDCLGANGNPLIRTPGLDRLASQSANFSSAYVQAPVCVPSRVSIFTGRYPHSHRNRVNYTPCDPKEVFLQRMFRDSGYQTGSAGKLHYFPPTADHARSTGFDQVELDDGVSSTDAYSDYVRWRNASDPKAATTPYTQFAPGKNPFRAAIDYEFTPAAWTGLRTREMLRRMASSPRPFFLFSSFFKPHSPYHVPVPYDSMYDGIEIPLPRRVTLESIRRLPLPVQKMILRFKPEYDMDRERLQWIYRSYYASVSMVDREIGAILDELDRSGRAADTIVVLTSDHGDQLLEHGLFGKNVFFEASVRIPLLLRFPGRIATGCRDDFVETVDLAPTLLDLCGLAIPTRIQGRSLVAGGYKPRDCVFAENIMPEVITGGPRGMEYGYTPGRGIAGIRHPDAKMVRTRDWKLNYYPGHTGELYDLRNDPGEEHNLYAERPAIVAELQQRLLDWQITAGETEQIAPRWLL